MTGWSRASGERTGAGQVVDGTEQNRTRRNVARQSNRRDMAGQAADGSGQEGATQDKRRAGN